MNARHVGVVGAAMLALGLTVAPVAAQTPTKLTYFTGPTGGSWIPIGGDQERRQPVGQMLRLTAEADRLRPRCAAHPPRLRPRNRGQRLSVQCAIHYSAGAAS